MSLRRILPSSELFEEEIRPGDDEAAYNSDPSNSAEIIDSCLHLNDKYWPRQYYVVYNSDIRYLWNKFLARC